VHNVAHRCLTRSALLGRRLRSKDQVQQSAVGAKVSDSCEKLHPQGSEPIQHVSFDAIECPIEDVNGKKRRDKDNQSLSLHLHAALSISLQ